MGKRTYPSDSDIRALLLKRVEQYCRKAKMAKSALGKAAIEDPAFILRVERGLNFRIGTYQRVMAFIDRGMARSR